MEIHHEAPATAYKEQFVQAPPDVVWQCLADITSWSQWMPDVTAAELKGPLEAGTQFIWKTGGMSIHSTLQVVEPNQKIGWTGQSFGAQAIHVWRFQPQETGTLVMTEESMEGWLVRFLRSFMQKILDRSLERWLQHLKEYAEREYAAAST